MTVSIERLSGDIARIHMNSVTGRIAGYGVSAYLVRDILIDTGFPWVGRRFMAAVRSLRPRGVIVTHWHEDHSGNAARLAAAGIPLLMHQQTEATLRAKPPIGLYRKVVWGPPQRLLHPLAPFDPAPLQVIEAPGHTDDHLIVWDAERRILVSGDLFLGVKVRIAHIHERPRLLIQSLRRALALRPKLLLDAHRGPLESPEFVLRAKITWMEETLGEIEKLADAGLTEREIQRKVLGPEEFTGRVSLGEYSRRGLVHAALAERKLP